MCVAYRSSWGTAQGQEIILRITVKREWFTRVLEAACTKGAKNPGTGARVKHARGRTADVVRLQWDPGTCVGTGCGHWSLRTAARALSKRAMAWVVCRPPPAVRQAATARHSDRPEGQVATGPGDR